MEAFPINFDAIPQPEIEKVWAVPDRLSKHFHGRDDEIARIQQKFQESTTNGPARSIIYGMPGVGKTELALKFAGIANREQGIPFVFWISGAATDKLNSGFSEILDHLHLKSRGSQSADNIVARKWLEEQGRQWLLVVDNVNEDSMETVRDMLPSTNNIGKVLITTRSELVARSLAYAFEEEHSILEVESPTTPTAIQMFLRASGLQSGSYDIGDVEKVVKNIGCLPLAIEQAASFASSPGQSVQSLLAIQSGPGSAELFEWENKLSKHEEKSVIACFTPLLDQVKQMSPLAWSLLQLCAFLDPESIILENIEDAIKNFKPYTAMKSRFLLHPGFRYELTDSNGVNMGTRDYVVEVDEAELAENMNQIREIFTTKVQTQKVLQILQESSLVRVKRDGTVTIWIHDLVHSMLQNAALHHTGNKWLRVGLCLIETTLFKISPYDHKQWLLMKQLVPHIQTFNRILARLQVTSLRHLRCETSLYEYYYRRYQHQQAEAILAKVFREYCRLLDEGDPIKLAIICKSAVNFYAQGKRDEAEAVVRAATLLFPDPHTIPMKGPVGYQICEIWRIYALLLQKQGQCKKAEAILMSLIERLRVFDDVRYQDCLGYLALLYKEQGRLEEAESTLGPLVHTYERKFGTNHIGTIMIRRFYAELRRGQGHFQEAKGILEDLISILLDAYGEDDAVTISTRRFLEDWEQEDTENERITST